MIEVLWLVVAYILIGAVFVLYANYVVSDWQWRDRLIVMAIWPVLAFMMIAMDND